MPNGIKIDGTGPVIDLQRINSIRTYEVMEQQLQSLDDIVSGENQALGFASLASGTFISTLVSWLTASQLSANAGAIYCAVTIVSGVFSLWFGLTWHRERKARTKLLAIIRGHETKTAAT